MLNHESTNNQISSSIQDYRRRNLLGKKGQTPTKNKSVVILQNVTLTSQCKITQTLVDSFPTESIVGLNYIHASSHFRIQLANPEAAIKVIDYFKDKEYDGRKIQASYELIENPDTTRIPHRSPP